ncbi:MerR family transcriptional regulator [Pedococcus sp. NPDC057267]|uniref:MerR family transcriptional regulator n=1 Tax=Pedococcus sp. NPDC057267 TaxID=3346077 RepID=UPI00362B643F
MRWMGPTGTEGRHSIGDVAELTGVAPGTLRAWETRYGVVSPSRTSTAYRSYSDDDVEVVRRMRVLVDSGIPARRAARMAGEASPVTAQESPGGPVAPGTPATAGSPLADHGTLTRVAARFDPVALQQALDEAFSLASVDRVIDDWLMPSLGVLGAAWEAGDVDVAGEHFVSSAVMRRLAALFEASGAQGPRVLVGLPPGSRHELPVLAFAVCLLRAGLDVLYLGPDVPLDSWPAVVRASAPRAVVISAAHSRDVEAASSTAEVLHDAGVPVVYVGGHAAGDVTGATPLPARLSSAAQLVRSALR